MYIHKDMLWFQDSTSEAVESEEQMEEPRDHTATDASTSCDIDDRAVEVSVLGITSSCCDVLLFISNILR